MQNETEPLPTIIRTEVWAKTVSFSLTSHAQFIEANDVHLLRLDGSLNCETVWKGRTYTHRDAVIEFDKCCNGTHGGIIATKILMKRAYWRPELSRIFESYLIMSASCNER